MKCTNCGRTHNRKRFCSNKCKDRWHNANTPGRQRFISSPSVDADDLSDSVMDSATSGWDEGGWLSDDSGVTTA